MGGAYHALTNHWGNTMTEAHDAANTESAEQRPTLVGIWELAKMFGETVPHMRYIVQQKLGIEPVTRFQNRYIYGPDAIAAVETHCKIKAMDRSIRASGTINRLGVMEAETRLDKQLSTLCERIERKLAHLEVRLAELEGKGTGTV